MEESPSACSGEEGEEEDEEEEGEPREREAPTRSGARRGEERTGVLRLGTLDSFKVTPKGRLLRKSLIDPRKRGAAASAKSPSLPSAERPGPATTQPDDTLWGNTRHYSTTLNAPIGPPQTTQVLASLQLGAIPACDRRVAADGRDGRRVIGT